MPRVLIVGGGSELQPQLRRIAAGVETVVLCRVSSLPHVHNQHENRMMVVLNDDCPTDVWVRVAHGVQAQWGVDAVASFADRDQDRAAAIAADLRLPFHSPETVHAVHDKLCMRARLNACGVEEVPYRAIGSAAELAEFCATAGLPVVVKPSCGFASAGIGVVRHAGDIANAYRTAVEAEAPLFGRSPPIAERFYPGREFSVEAITHAGVHHVFAITEKFSDERTKVELGHVVPARVTSDEARLLVEHVRAALTALGVAAGPTHTEVILGPDGPVLVETHLRDAGDEIPRLVEDATGTDMAQLFLCQAIGTDIGALPELAARRDGPCYRGAGAIRYLAADGPGVLAGIDGWNEVRRMPGVRDAQQLLPDGAPLDRLTDSFSRLGYVRVRGGDADQALARAHAAVSALRIRIRA
jgi:biotin carboxylase